LIVFHAHYFSLDKFLNIRIDKGYRAIAGISGDLMVKAVCGDCEGLVYVGGAAVYQCKSTGDALDQKTVEERIEIECDKFNLAPRTVKIEMGLEVGMTTVYGGGSVQLPAEIRRSLDIKDGDKILWIRKGRREFTFRKVGLKPSVKGHYV